MTNVDISNANAKKGERSESWFPISGFCVWTRPLSIEQYGSLTFDIVACCGCVGVCVSVGGQCSVQGCGVYAVEWFVWV